MESTTFGDILYIGRAFMNYRKQLKLEDSLMPSEMLFISYIYRHQGCTQDQIVKFTGMDKTTVAHRLNKLENMGYVRREIAESDARKRLCFLTEKAEDIYPLIHEQYIEFKNKVLGDFTEEELMLLNRMTSRMKENAEKLISTSEPKTSAKVIFPEEKKS